MPVHGIDNGNNKHDVYTTEELLSILQQAINSGSLQGIDPTQTPIVAAVRESHNNSDVTFWSGTEAEFNELTGVTSELVGARIGSDGRLYILTGDTTLSDTVEAARQAALEATEGMKREVISVTLMANAWSNSAPYTQTVSVAGMTADKDFLAPYVVPTGNESDDLAAQVALSCISGGTTDTDSVTFYCYEEKPTTTITVFMVDKGTKIEPGGYPIASKTAPGIMQVGDGLNVDENGKVSVGSDDDSAVYIFPGKWGDDMTSGNSNLVIVDGKTLLFDTNQSSQYSYLKSMLDDNGVNHLDYVIISHFDADHYGNFINLVDDGYIDSDTKYYHGLFSDVFYASRTAYEAIESKCTENNIVSTVPNDLVTITDGDIQLKFGNTNLEYAEANYTNANSASMVVMLTHNNSTALFMGDALWNTEKYLFEQKFIDRQIDLYCVPHHAIEKTCYLSFVKSVSPKIAFAQTQFQDYRKNKLTRHKETALLNELGADVYYSFAHDNNPVFIEQNGHFNCINASVDGYVGAELDNTSTFYVDASTDNIVQNGTEEYPFKDLPQALGKIGAYSNASIVIHLEAGTYGTQNNIDMLKNQIPCFNNVNLEIIGDSAATTVLDQGVIAINSNLVLRNVTINVNDSSKEAINLKYSNVTLRDCAITNTRSTASSIGCYLEKGSDLVLLNVDFSSVATGVEQHGGSCSVQNVSADAVTYLFSLSTTSVMTIMSLGTLTSVTNLFKDSNGVVNVKPATQSVTMTKSVGSFDLEQSNKLYNKLLITYSIRRNGTNYGTAQKLLNYVAASGVTISEFNNHPADSTPIIYGASATLTLSDGGINVTRNGSYTQTATETTFYAGSSSDVKEGIRISEIQFLRV